jgi:hypothetical protein
MYSAKDTLAVQEGHAMAVKRRKLAQLDRPPAVKRVVPIRRLDPKALFEGWVCSPKPWIFVTHWKGDRSSPHVVDESECPGCKMQLPKRPRGYLLVVPFMEKGPVFFELTHLALEALQEQASEESIRGKWIAVKRERPVFNAPMIATLSKIDRPAPELPVDISPVPTLSVLWGMNGELC